MTAIITKGITFSCDAVLDKQIREHCKSKRYSVSDFVRECVKKQLKQLKE